MEEEKEDEDESVGPVLHYSGPPVVTPLMSQEDEIQVDFTFSFSFIHHLAEC